MRGLLSITLCVLRNNSWGHGGNHLGLFLPPPQDIALILPSPSEGPVSELEQLSNSLPSKELMAAICDCLLATLTNSESSYSCLLTCVRTMMFLAEHDYGLFHLKR